jgi:hypothetical protein
MRPKLPPTDPLVDYNTQELTEKLQANYQVQMQRAVQKKIKNDKEAIARKKRAMKRMGIPISRLKQFDEEVVGELLNGENVEEDQAEEEEEEHICTES